MRVCVEGNIGAGKSGVVAALAAAYPGARAVPEPVDAWRPILDEFYRDPGTWALPFSLRVLLHFASVDAAAAATAAPVVVERSPAACRHVFGAVLRDDGHLSAGRWDLLNEYADSLGWDPDVVLFVDTPADACLLRIAARGRACEAGIDVQYLRRLEFQYEHLVRASPARVVRLDGTLPPADLAAAAVAAAAPFLSST